MSEHIDDNPTEKIEKMVTMAVAAAKGVVPLGQVVLPLTQIAHGDLAPPEARHLAQVLLRILKGERDPLVLAEELTPGFAEIVWEALEQIEAPLPEPDDEIREGFTFEQLVEKMAEACSGEVMLWQQLWNFTAELANDANLPPEIQTLGSVLRRILAGERQKYLLAELAPEHRWAVEQLLDWLIEQAVKPEPGENTDWQNLTDY